MPNCVKGHQPQTAAIAYFEDAIRESDEIIAECSPGLQAELTEQKAHFVVALEAMRVPLPDNKALTVEELREMEGQPVWVVCLYPKWQFWHKDQWAICGISLAKEVLINLEDNVLIEVDYGSGWLAYRRPPKKVD